MNHNVLAAMIALNDMGLPFTDHRLEQELVKPCITAQASMQALSSLHMQDKSLEHNLETAAKSCLARIFGMSDAEIEKSWPSAVARYKQREAFLIMTGRLNQEAA